MALKNVLLALTTKKVIATWNCLFVIGDWASVLYTMWFYMCDSKAKFLGLVTT